MIQAALALIVAFQSKGGVSGIVDDAANTHACLRLSLPLLCTNREQGRALASVTELDQD